MLVPVLLAGLSVWDGPAANAYELGPLVRFGVMGGFVQTRLTYTASKYDYPPGSRTYGEAAGPALGVFGTVGLRIASWAEVQAAASWQRSVLDTRFENGLKSRSSESWFGLGGGFAFHPGSPRALLAANGLLGSAAASTGISPAVEAIAGWEGEGPSAVGVGIQGSAIAIEENTDPRFGASQLSVALVLFGRAEL